MDIVVRVNKVKGKKMGSFEISIGNYVLFSKLALGYFPHVTAASARVADFLKDWHK